MEYLDEKEIVLKKEENKTLQLEYKGKSYGSVHVYLAFPLQSYNEFICFYNEEDKEEIGILKNIDLLSLEYQKLVKEEISFRYFMPEIIKFTKSIYKRNQYTFEAITTAGNRTIIIKDLIYNVFLNPDKSVVIRDIEENYYLLNKYLSSNDKYIRLIKNYI